MVKAYYHVVVPSKAKRPYQQLEAKFYRKPAVVEFGQTPSLVFQPYKFSFQCLVGKF